MKTNVIMNRYLGDLIIHQRTKDGMFNSTGLLKQWNKKNNKKKSMAEFFRLAETNDFINTIMREEKSPIDNSQLGYNKVVDLIKGKNTSLGKTDDEIWMHPYLFIKFAMWLNTEFEYHVIKFVYDSLIELRKETSDLYNKLCDATHAYVKRNKIRETPQNQCKTNAKLIQYKIFGEIFYENPWQEANEDELKLRKQLEGILIVSYENNYRYDKTQMLVDAQLELFKLMKN